VSASPTSRSGGVDLSTLLTTAVASAVAAYVTSRIWAAGTLAAAAFTPVLVALLKELLMKPAAAVTRAVPVRGVVRSASQAGEPDGAPHTDTAESIEARIAQLGEAPGWSRPGRRRAWQVAVVTGLLGFILAAVIITVPELVAGSSASGGGRDTTLFGGHASRSARTPADTTTTTTPTTTTPEGAAPTQSVTVAPPAGTVTVPPPAPQTTVPPEQTPAPAQTTPEVPATPPPPPAPPG
jgi:hypothetical protein